MTENENARIIQRQASQISLRELIVKTHGLLRYLLTKWLVILIVVVFSSGIGLLYSLTKEINYTAKLSFILEDQSNSGGGLGAAASIAAQFGFNLGGISSSGGFFEGDNIIEFLKSRSMLDKTLLTEVVIDGERDLLVNRYIEYNKFREKWREKASLTGIQFKDTTGVYLQDSLMAEFYKLILARNLVIGKPDKKINIIAIEMESPDPKFSKAFVETLIENASNFYIETRTRKAKENLAILTHQVDSVRQELNDAISGVAAAADANPNPNRAFQSLRVGSQLRAVDVQANTAILTELVKNQELAKITLRNEKPVIQVLDKPILPLESDRIGKAKAIIIGGFLGGVLICLVLVMRHVYRQIMDGDPA